jgi:hypothetical protein
MDFAAIDGVVDDLCGFIERSESALWDRLCACEDDAEIGELISTITSMGHVDGCARALGLRAMVDGGAAPAMAVLARTCAGCMDESGENVPWTELADLFDRATVMACAPEEEEGAQIDADVLAEASMAVERRLAENKSAAAERRAAAVEEELERRFAVEREIEASCLRDLEFAAHDDLRPVDEDEFAP